MKIRNGFVSNSSSSSFVVEVKSLFDRKQKLSADQIQSLLDFGFYYSDFYFPANIEWNENWKSTKPNEYSTLACSVICNESDVISFLISKKIPFKALCHYGHYSVLWDGKNKIKRIRNPGIEEAMYENKTNDGPIYSEFTIEEWENRYK